MSPVRLLSTVLISLLSVSSLASAARLPDKIFGVNLGSWYVMKSLSVVQPSRGCAHANSFKASSGALDVTGRYVLDLIRLYTLCLTFAFACSVDQDGWGAMRRLLNLHRV